MLTVDRNEYCRHGFEKGSCVACKHGLKNTRPVTLEEARRILGLSSEPVDRMRGQE